jgi:hypothetical protein
MLNKLKIQAVLIAAISLSTVNCIAALQAYFPFEKDTAYSGVSENRLQGKASKGKDAKSAPVLVSDAPEATKHSRSSLETAKGIVCVRNVSKLNMGNTFSLNLWVKLNASDSEFNGLIAQRGNFVKMDWVLFYRKSYRTLYFWAGSQAKHKFEVKLPTPLEKDSWHMLTFVKTPEALNFYIDSHKVKLFPFKASISSDNYLVIGGIDAAGTYAFDGCIDDVALWDNALNETQISELFKGHPPAELVKEKIQRWNFAPAGSSAVLPEVSSSPKAQKEIVIYRNNKQHPCVSYTPASIAKAKANINKFDWAKKYFAKELQNADRWLSKPANYWLQFLPKPGAYYAYGFTGCPICGADTGTWLYARCSWDKPGKVACANGHLLPDNAHPDNGKGYKAPNQKIHYLVGSWNAWVTEQWTLNAIPSLTLAYAITGKDKYAELACTLLDALASIYAESTSGSMDYPGYQIGRLARPNYQVARNLVKYVDAYDLLYNYKGMERPSLKKGFSRRRNIEENMLLDGAYFCYTHCFTNSLHNGHADYMRGALAVGCLLKIPEYINTVVNGPFGILAMTENNSDRDGNYYESTLGYGIHARQLYLTYAEPLKNYRSQNFPNGVNLYNNPKFVKFYEMPNLYFKLSGHTPNFGDNNPTTYQAAIDAAGYDPVDHLFAEMVYNGTTDISIKKQFGKLLAYFSHGKKEFRRGQIRDKNYLLFNTAELSLANTDANESIKPEKLSSSWNLGQKGIALLRSGKDKNIQGALLRYGPTLTHGDFDELGLLYYAGGRQLTYEIGYGSPASTHTQTGWASQTASHTLVCVNEKSQSGVSGSGGSLELFASTPSLQLVEADASMAYASEKVSRYRRTIALIGKDKNQILIDFFRVKGGWQHDYIIATYGTNQHIDGVKLQKQLGSLAGENINWAGKIGKDGNIKGQLKPYWNAPPQNGYGFFYDIREGSAKGYWNSLWDIGQVKFKVHMAADSGDTAITAKAPGLRPSNAKGSYAIWRRKGKAPLESCFAAVMEPSLPSLAKGLVSYSAAKLLAALGEANCSVKSIISSLGIILIKGQSEGSFAEFAFDIEKAGSYDLIVKFRKAPVYGKAAIILDGNEVGRISALAESITDITEFNPGKINLKQGSHVLSIKMLKPDSGNAFMFGLAGLELRSENYSPEKSQFHEILKSVERLQPKAEKSCKLQPAALLIKYASGENAYVISSSLDNPPVLLDTEFGKVRLDGAFVVLKGKDGKLENINGCAVRSLNINGTEIQLPPSVATGRISGIDRKNSLVALENTLKTIPGKGIAIFDNPDYSRNTSYAYELGSNGKLDLLKASTSLGRGMVSAKPDDQTILSTVPHEYARKLVNRYNDMTPAKREKIMATRFFQGKQIVSGSSSTVIKSAQMLYKKPMQLKLKSNRGFQTGEQFEYMDIKTGDACVMINGFEINLRDK